MDVKSFVDQILRGLSASHHVLDTAITAEGPIVDGYGFISENLYLHFYFNEITATVAFALIQDQQRIWGIDYDNRCGWHMHPLGAPETHEPIAGRSIGGILDLLDTELAKLFRD